VIIEIADAYSLGDKGMITFTMILVM
jgi:hypothetical protein